MINETSYLLIKLIEECAEVTKAATKAIRFGLEPTQDGDNEYDNRAELREEIVHLLACIDRLEEELIIVIPGLEIPHGLIALHKRQMAHYHQISKALGLSQ